MHARVMYVFRIVSTGEMTRELSPLMSFCYNLRTDTLINDLRAIRPRNVDAVVVAFKEARLSPPKR